MKTAMQELILKLPNEFIFDNPIIIIDALKKEKEQIIDAYINGFPDDWESDKRIRYAKEYYNMNYNQNK